MVSKKKNETDPEWGAPWPSLEDRLVDVLDANPLLTLLLWRDEPGRGERPEEHLRRVVSGHLHRIRLGLDRLSNQVLEYVAFRGYLTRTSLLVEAASVDPDELDLRVRRLTTLGLLECVAGMIVIAEGVERIIVAPLPIFRQSAELLTSDQLGRACQLLGVNAAARKADRLEAVARVIEDPVRLRDLLTDLGPAATVVFAKIASRSLPAGVDADERSDLPSGAVGVWDLDLDPSLLVRGYGSNYGVDRRLGRSALEDLAERCLIGTGWGHHTWMWMECHVAINGSMFASWPSPKAPLARLVDEPIGVASRVVASAELFVEQLGADQPVGKKTGDRLPMVKAIKSAGNAVGLDPAMSALLSRAVIHHGLLIAVDRPRTGRGRNAEWPVAWVMNPERLERWRAWSPELRWLSLVQAWLVSGADQPGRVSPWTSRVFLISALASLDPGMGVPTSEVAEWMADRHGAGAMSDYDEVIEDLVRLGVCSGGSTIGLSRGGRAMLGSHVASAEVSAELASDFLGDSTTFVVQPDHTIITSSDLPPAILTTLLLVAEHESAGGAVVWRLSAARLTRASRRLSAEEIIGFLRDHSSVPISDNVVRFIDDHVIATKVLRVGASFSHIVHDDLALVAAAVAVKSARLELLAPGVAVSPLEPAKLHAALSAKGIVVEVDGAFVDAGDLNPAGSRQVVQPDSGRPLLGPLPIPLGPGVVASLALLHGSGTARTTKDTP